MEKRLNISEIASLAGVSTATVSRVLNDYPYVKESTRERVKKVIQETNYRVNAIARKLRRKKTHTIGVIVSNVLSPFYSVIAKSVEDVAIKNNFSTVLCNGGDKPEKEAKYLEVLHENRVDGIIISPTGKNKDYLNFLLASGIPIVFIDRPTEGVDCDIVMVNNMDVTFNALDFAIKKGYKKIGCIAGPQDRYTGIERFKGYKKALKNNGIAYDESLVRFGDFTYESGYSLARELLDSEKPDLLFVANSDMAMGAYKYISEKGYKIPHELGFLMFDDPQWASLVTPRVTVISQPVYMLGSTAADILFKRIMEGGQFMDQSPLKIILEAKFVVRESI